MDTIDATNNFGLTIPNLPGMTPNRRAWVYVSQSLLFCCISLFLCGQREKEGFKRSGSRPASAAAARTSTISPNFDRSAGGLFSNQTGTIEQRNSDSQQLFRPVSATTLRPTTSASIGYLQQPQSGFLNRPSTAGASLSRSASAPLGVKLPRYVETDKQVARFYGHFFQERPFDKYGPLGDRVVERYMARFMTIHVYVYDGTVEINEPKETNSGMSQGTFYRRGVLYKSDGERVTLQDLVPGNVVSMLGRDFHITDADAFTRDYFKYVLPHYSSPSLSLLCTNSSLSFCVTGVS